jgi:hypothetical protein
VRVAGAPAGAVRLVPAAAGVVVEALAAGVRVAGHPVPPGTRRLLRAGEHAELRGRAVRLEPVPAPDATRAAASPLLRGEACGAAAVVLTGARAGERHAIGLALTVGRGRAAGLRVPDPLASRVHLRLRAEGGAVTVEDLGSKNGVRVNGVALDRRPSPVATGDEIALGDTVLGIEDPWSRAGAIPPAPPARGARRTIPPRFLAALLLALSAAALALAAP